MQISIELIAFLSPIASTLLIWYIQYKYTKMDKRREKLFISEQETHMQREKEKDAQNMVRAEKRKQENILTMRMIKAVGKLSYANSVAIREGKVNGIMEEALVYYKDISDEMSEFLHESAAEFFVK